MKNKVLVSAIITTYKREWKIVERAIKSVLQQSYQNIELIVVDDNENNSFFSKELKKNIDENYPDIRYLKQNSNQGACAARNLGLWNANGFFVAYLDDDDEWLCEKIEKQVNAYFAADNPSIGMVSCDGFTIEKRGVKKPYNSFGMKRIPEYITFRHMLRGDYVGSTSQPLIVTRILQSLNGFEEKLPARQDYEMWLRVSRKNSILFLRERLFLHHMHDGEQISRNPLKCAKGYIHIYREFYKDFQKDKIAKAHCIQLIQDNIRNSVLAKIN